MNLNNYLKTNSDYSVTVTTDKILVYISKRWETCQLLSVTDVVSTIGIFEITIDSETKGFYLPGVLTMKPSEVSFETIDGDDFVRCVFTKGDTFIVDTRVVQSAQIAYHIFSEFAKCGKIPPFFNYDNMAFAFDIVEKVTGADLKAEHSTFEMIWAYLARDPKNFRTMWRHTSMTGKPKYYKLLDVPHLGQSTTSKLISSRLTDSLASSMVNAAEEESDIENMYRR